ncbi:hypothetical protein [Mycobacterium szulgai]|uniref:hypothetical protein n=1 Tax=Mycobacterium szulgai TaxID=1787 RepID=UPI00111C4124|nr:hypothetical protein [Mycobacterium szulgai]MCV7079835.1 hypothetical protein [Mycobacterium szulgai]
MAESQRDQRFPVRELCAVHRLAVGLAFVSHHSSDHLVTMGVDDDGSFVGVVGLVTEFISLVIF